MLTLNPLTKILPVLLIPLITACQPSDPIIDATPIPTVGAPSTDAPTAVPPIPTPTPDAIADTDRATNPPRTNMPAVGEPVDPLLFTPTPATSEDRYRERAESTAAYLLRVCLNQESAAHNENTSQIVGTSASDDGQVIYFALIPDGESIQTGFVDLWTVNIDGTNLRHVLSEASVQTHDIPEHIAAIKWLPNTHQLVFNTIGQDNWLPYNNLHLIDADTGQHRVLIPGKYTPFEEGCMGANGGEFYPSPDGKHIATVTATTVSLVDADGNNLRDEILIYDFVDTQAETIIFATITWSPDSSGVWIAVPPTTGETAIEVYFATMSGDLRKAGEVQVPMPDSTLSPSGMVSPSGEHLLYYHEGLHIARVDGTEDVLYWTDAAPVSWIDATHFIYVNNQNERYIGEIGGDPVRAAAPEPATCLSFP